MDGLLSSSVSYPLYVSAGFKTWPICLLILLESESRSCVPLLVGNFPIIDEIAKFFVTVLVNSQL
jgi:hypothetical protein